MTKRLLNSKAKQCGGEALELIEGRAGPFEQRSGHRLDEAKGGEAFFLAAKKLARGLELWSRDN